jgi:hypothetical protein
MDANGCGPSGRTDDEVGVNDDRLLDDKIVDIDSGPDNIGIGEITSVEDGKLEGKKGDQKK